VAIALALPLGMIAAIRRGTWIDTLATTISLSGISIPQMMFAPLLILWGFITLGWFPGPTEVGPRAMVLPALAVGTHLMAMLARMTRSSLVEVLGEDYVRTARAKGLASRTIIWPHALKNAMLPVLTVIALEFAFLLGGLVVTEQVFNLNGIGRLMVLSVQNQDYTLTQALVMVVVTIAVLSNLVVDLFYAWLDPRIRLA
jgi:peptide/nickel transport system permease protein